LAGVSIGEDEKLSVVKRDGNIILEPVRENPVKAGRGMLRTGGRVLKQLIEDRKIKSLR